MSKSPFSEAAQSLVSNGLSVIPLRARDKAPIPKGWQKYSKEKPSPDDISRWSQIKDANIGVVLGEASGIVAVDYDEHPEFWELVAEMLPVSPIKKRGAKGYTAFYRYNGEKNASFKYKNPKTGQVDTVIDILSDGRQTVVPPSKHPDGYDYRYLTRLALSDTLRGLPKLPDDLIQYILEIVERFDVYTRTNCTQGEQSPAKEPDETITQEEVKKALSYINPDLSYEEWAHIGMALKHQFGHHGLGLWDEYSTRGSKYCGRKKLESLWESFRGSGITIGTVFKYAKDAGYDPRMPDDEDFQDLWPDEAKDALEEEIGAPSTPQPTSGIATTETKVESSPNKPPKEKKSSKPPVIKKLKYPLTDSANADRFVHYFGDRFRFCPAFKWLYYDGKKWNKKAELVASKYAEKTANMIIRERDYFKKDEKLLKKFNTFIESSHNGTRLNNMIRLARGREGILTDASAFDNDIWYLNCANGFVDLRTGELKEHNPKLMSTRITNISYDPEATCPMWKEYLDLVMDGDAEMIDYLQRIAGYCLTGSTGEQVMFFIFGDGSNGKSVFIETLSEIAGDYSAVISTKSLCLSHSNSAQAEEMAASAGARLITVGETQVGQTWDESLLKDMTGGDKVRACLKFCDSFDFVPRSKLIIRGNNKPRVRGTDEGIWRRFHLIPFEIPIPKDRKDPHFKEKLWAAELPGILNWAIQGAIKWREWGLRQPSMVERAVETYREENDLIGAFLLDEVVELSWGDGSNKVAWENNAIHSRELFERFQDWCKRCGVQAWTISTFGRELKKRRPNRGEIVRWKRVGSGVVHLGLKLVEEFDNEVPETVRLWQFLDREDDPNLQH